MASTKDFFEYIKEQFSNTPDISFRAMMGEYIIYCRGKVIGGIYDNRLLVKPTASALALLPCAAWELPYEGGSKMLLVEELEYRQLICALAQGISDDLPEPKRKSGTKSKI